MTLNETLSPADTRRDDVRWEMVLETENRLMDQLRSARAMATQLVGLSPLHEAGFAIDLRTRIVDLLDILGTVTRPRHPHCRCSDDESHNHPDF